MQPYNSQAEQIAAAQADALVPDTFNFFSHRIPVAWKSDDNLVREISDDVRLAVGKLHLAWGTTEFRLTDYIQFILEINGQPRKKLSKLERKWAMRQIIAEAKNNGLPIEAHVWRMYWNRMRMAVAVRNDLAHGHLVGTLKDPEGSLVIARVDADGRLRTTVHPAKNLTVSIDILEKLDQYLYGMNRAVTKFMNDKDEGSSINQENG